MKDKINVRKEIIITFLFSLLIIVSVLGVVLNKPIRDIYFSPAQTGYGVDCSTITGDIQAWRNACPCSYGDTPSEINPGVKFASYGSQGHLTNACQMCNGYGGVIGKTDGTPLNVCTLCDGNGGTRFIGAGEKSISQPEVDPCGVCDGAGNWVPKLAGTSPDPNPSVIPNTGAFHSVFYNPTPGGSSCNVCDGTGFVKSIEEVIPKTVNISDIIDIKIDYDPDYVRLTKQFRGFTPQPEFTPYDNILIKIKIAKNSCYTYPNELPFDVALAFTNIDGQEEVFYFVNQATSIANPYSPIKISETTNEIEYGVILKGWNYHQKTQCTAQGCKDVDIDGGASGIVQGALMDKMIEAIGKDLNKKDVVKFRLMERNVPANNKDEPIPMKTCLQIKGDGKKKFVGMRGEDAFRYSSKTFMQEVFVDANTLFSIDPFAKYNDSLSYYADLAILDDSGWDTYEEDNDIFYKPKYISVVRQSSSCGSDASAYSFFNKRTYKGYTVKNSGTVFVRPGGLSLSSDSIVVTHEIGHAFCGLSDEYVYKKGFTGFVWNPGWQGKFMPNCVLNPSNSWWYNGAVYGTSNYLGCSVNGLYRPSGNSIMRKDREDQKFNVVSCGYCLAAIKGGNPKSYWNECMNLDTIKPLVT
ncbi:MAG: hypothetical protein AABW80_02500 [Nanoarchaeota archaeon]